MTLIVGICNRESCIMVADNMGTANVPIESVGASSSGQALKYNADDFFLKISNPLPNCMVGISGSMSTGRFVNEKIRAQGKIDSIKELFEEVLYKIPENLPSALLLISFFDRSDTIMKMFQWKSSQPKGLLAGDYFLIGSGAPVMDEEKLWPEISSIFLQPANFQERLDYISFLMNRCMFEKGISDELIDNHVGGLFFGFGLSEAGFIPQSDTIILNPEPIDRLKTINVPMIYIGYKNNLLCIFSELIKTLKIISADGLPNQEVLEIVKRFKIDKRSLYKLEQIANIEIHTKYNNIKSAFIKCKDPGSLLTYRDSELVFHNDLKTVIRKLINREDLTLNDFEDQ